MPLQMQIDEGAGWAAVDLEAEALSDFKFGAGYSHATMLSFVCHQPHHTKPLPAYAKVRFWDDGAVDRFGNDFTEDNPLFLGFIEQIKPTEESNKIEYSCLDSTARVSSETQVMSTAWSDADTPDPTSVPRLVLNGSIDNDDDWSNARAFDQTVGQMIAVLLDDPLLRLREYEAAPAADTAYLASDLSGLDYEPQEKVVFTGEPLRSAVMRLIDDWEPRWRLLFWPGTKQWRFGDIGLSSALTYTLNDFTVNHPVLKLQMDRSLENRYTAVKIYGPEATQNTTITLSGGGLTEIAGGPELDSYGAGGIVQGQSQWQITDSTKWRMGRILPEAIFAPQEEIRWAPNAFNQQSIWTRSPTLMVKYKNNSGGTDAWQSQAGWTYSHLTGLIDFKGRYIYRYNHNPEIEGGILQPNVENPEDVMLIYPRFIEPLSVRVPASGFEGTAYTDDGLENELRLPDDQLAVGHLFGVPVTSATKIAKFQVLAQKILDSKKDVLYHGGMTLQGIDYSFHLLDRKVNIAGVDGSGAPLTTGWEALNAIVTDVEYDFEEQVTTVQFSSDHSELLGFDPERIKEQLKIGAEYITRHIRYWSVNRSFVAHTEWGTPYIAQALSVGASITPIIVDPYTGNVDRPEFST